MPVNLELQMSSFAGYDNAETSTYLGTQCHGVMWPETAQLPAAWPICPPTVSGKVSCQLSVAEASNCRYGLPRGLLASATYSCTSTAGAFPAKACLCLDPRVDGIC